MGTILPCEVVNIKEDNIHEVAATVETEFPVPFSLAFPLFSC